MASRGVLIQSEFCSEGMTFQTVNAFSKKIAIVSLQTEVVNGVGVCACVCESVYSGARAHRRMCVNAIV